MMTDYPKDGVIETTGWSQEDWDKWHMNQFFMAQQSKEPAWWDQQKYLRPISSEETISLYESLYGKGYNLPIPHTPYLTELGLLRGIIDCLPRWTSRAAAQSIADQVVVILKGVTSAKVGRVGLFGRWRITDWEYRERKNDD
jgi:hypothetical protein